jgi:HD-GYP domain-containing protein (c-di-GMP phosphodiesterase class II)
MKEAMEFLTGLAQTLSTMSLYGEEHPARERAVGIAHERVQRLQEVMPAPRFTFLGDEIIVDGMPVRGLGNWDWSRRLSRVGVQRLELTGPVTRDDLEVFLDEVLGLLTDAPGSTAERRQSRPTNIRYGRVGLKSEEGEGREEGSEGEKVATATLTYTLREELDTVDWLHTELRDRQQLHLLEAEAIIRSLSVAMHGDQDFMIPLLRLKRFDQYTTTHAMNVSVLSMALAEFIGLGPRQVKDFGISGLLHDLGKVTIPDEILNKPGKLTDAERQVMNNHTVEGARLIMETEDHLDLAAVVAYEHHIKLDGGGYPKFNYARKCHQASDMVHVCDVFDALRTHRPYRDAWEHDRVLDYIAEGAGTEFDPDLARAFVRMMRQWEHRVATVEEEDAPVLTGASSAVAGDGGAGAGGPEGSEPPSA